MLMLSQEHVKDTREAYKYMCSSAKGTVVLTKNRRYTKMYTMSYTAFHRTKTPKIKMTRNGKIFCVTDNTAEKIAIIVCN